MSENQKPTVSFIEYIGNIVFDKKNKEETILKTFTLEEQVVNYSNQVLGVKVQSVVLPFSYKGTLKTEKEVMDWLRYKVQSRHSFAYSMALKYGEKLKIKLEQKKPYVDN